jgi:hypothetical protein
MDGEAVALLAEPVWVVATTENSIGGVIHAGDRREAPTSTRPTWSRSAGTRAEVSLGRCRAHGALAKPPDRVYPGIGLVKVNLDPSPRFLARKPIGRVSEQVARRIDHSPDPDASPADRSA